MLNKNNRSQINKGLRRVVIFFALCLFAVAAIVVYFVFVTKTCHTADCLAKAANDCRKAKLESVDEAGIFWQYRVSAPCGRFEKTLIYLNEKETESMKKLLEGKSLSCNYTRGNFDKRWIDSLIFGLENCEGELKETVGQLLFLAQ